MRRLLLCILLLLAAPVPASAATLRVSPTGSDANACTATAPCATLDRAYRVAVPGDDVEVASGSYPTQTLSSAAKATCPARIVFHPLVGTTPTLANLLVESGSCMTFKSLAVTSKVWARGSSATVPTTDVTFDDLTAQTVKFYGNVDRGTIRGGSYGNTTDWQPQINSYNGTGSEPVPEDILVEGGNFHDFLASPGSHTECFQVLRGTRITLRGNRMTNCQGTGGIGITDGPTNGLTIENNMEADSVYGAQITRNVTNLVLRNNSFEDAFFFSDTGNSGPYTVAGNYGPYNVSLCKGATYSFNVLRGGTCGPTDLNVASLKFKDAAANDLHLAAGSEAVDYMQSGYPGTDFDGDSRPQGAAGDAGADEVLAAQPTPTPTPTPSPTPTPTDTPTPTPTPTPTDTPTPTPTATASPYAPACAPTCDEQIQALQQKINDALAALNR